MTVKVQKRIRPRSRPNWSGVFSSDRTFQLSRDLSDELCEIAELEPVSRNARAMLFSVTEELGMLRSAETALDHGPRPAHKLRLLQSVLKKAKKDPPDCWVEEAQILASCPDALAWEFHIEGFPKNADAGFVEKEWSRFAEAVQARLCKQESRHGPRHKAKHRLVNELAFIFDAYADPERKEDRERLRAEFVATALTGAGIQKPNPEKLRHKSSSRLARELPEPFTPPMARRRMRLYKRIVTAAEAKGQSVEAFLTENPAYYAEYRKAVPRVKKS